MFFWELVYKPILFQINFYFYSSKLGHLEDFAMRFWQGGSVAEWFRVLDLKSGGPWFKSSTLSEFVLGSPEFNF